MSDGQGDRRSLFLSRYSVLAPQHPFARTHFFRTSSLLARTKSYVICQCTSKPDRHCAVLCSFIKTTPFIVPIGSIIDGSR